MKSSASILALARHHCVEMPIAEVVALINGTPTVEAARRLMNRSPKAERYDT
ncbi:oxidoreductase subunit [Streptomyces sp. KPB2]|uniref:oxidoreductase subunit n=1 Tax=unclassified Streptomyces TaxID=2593676 RepID=UPI000F70CCF3|nr:MULTISPECIES: oxidoreductase subunit [unclassified Streptomyces]AZM79805.1 oxidoreductase subunit [Streptomyces sp. KPB2]MDU0251772.1 oxidoreductase subunit [Streptomyces sp. PU10]